MQSPSKTMRRRQPGSGNDDQVNENVIEETPLPDNADTNQKPVDEKIVVTSPKGVIGHIKFIVNDAKAAFGHLIFGGQVGYFLVGSVYVGITDAILPNWLAVTIDNLFTSEGTTFRIFVSTVQFVIRAAVCASSIFGGFIALIFGTSLIAGAGIGYAYLNTPGDPALLLTHRRDITSTFAAGSLLGFLLPFWIPDLFETTLYFSISFPFSIAGLLWKYNEEKVKTEAKKKKEEENKTILGKVKNTLADAVVGEISVDGHSSDIKLGDVVNAVTVDHVTVWKNTMDSRYQLAARFFLGLSYGVVLHLGWYFIADMVFPFLKSLFVGERSFIFRFLFDGLRPVLTSNF